MTERAERRLLDLKARQEAGEHMMCPRCGRDAMKAPVHTNALSRTADVYVCDACGTAEAMLAFMKQDYPLHLWAAFQPSGRRRFQRALGARGHGYGAAHTERRTAAALPALPGRSGQRRVVQA